MSSHRRRSGRALLVVVFSQHLVHPRFARTWLYMCARSDPSKTPATEHNWQMTTALFRTAPTSSDISLEDLEKKLLRTNTSPASIDKCWPPLLERCRWILTRRTSRQRTRTSGEYLLPFSLRWSQKRFKVSVQQCAWMLRAADASGQQHKPETDHARVACWATHCITKPTPLEVNLVRIHLINLEL